MSDTSDLITRFRKLTKAIEEEMKQNPAFASKIESIIHSKTRGSSRRKSATKSPSAIDGLHEKFDSMEPEAFKLWLVDHNIEALKAAIRANGFDPTRRTAKWKKPEKLTEYIIEKLSASDRRGSSFLT